MSRLNRTILLILICLWTLPSALWIYAHFNGNLQTGNIISEAVLAASPYPNAAEILTLVGDDRSAAIEHYVDQSSRIDRARTVITQAVLPPAMGYGLILLLLLPLRFMRQRPPT